MWLNVKLDEIRKFINVLNNDVINNLSDKQLITDLESKENRLDLEINFIKKEISLFSTQFSRTLQLLTQTLHHNKQLNDDAILLLSIRLSNLKQFSQESVEDYVAFVSSFLSYEIVTRIIKDYDPLNESSEDDHHWLGSNTGTHASFTDTTYTETTTESFYESGLDDGGVAESMGE